jgi:hypothetical protein
MDRSAFEMNTVSRDTPPLACDLTAIPAPAREQHLLTTTQVFNRLEAVQELTDGYALRLPNEDEMLMSLARFIENERRCCPFFSFVLEVEPNAGPLWLRLTGGPGVKELLRATLSERLDEAALKQLIQTGGEPRLDAAVARAVPAISDSFKKASLG